MEGSPGVWDGSGECSYLTLRSQWVGEGLAYSSVLEEGETSEYSGDRIKACELS